MKCFGPAVSVSVFFAAMAVLNGSALYRAAENMKFDAVGRKALMKVTKPLASCAELLHLGLLRNKTEQFERKYLE